MPRERATLPKLLLPPHPGREFAGKFPVPMMRNFFIPSGLGPTAAHPFSDALTAGSAADTRFWRHEDDFDLQGAEQLGPDWYQAFFAYMQEHLSYPRQAIINDEQGEAQVQFTVDQYGRVKGLRLVSRSGSVFLDTESTGVLRDARLPPFPDGTTTKDLPMQLTIHYILVR